MAIKNMKATQRSKYWNELVEILKDNFPKKKCKERGQALVMLAQIDMLLALDKTAQEALYEKTMEPRGYN